MDIINAINLGRPIPVADGFTGDVITLDAAIDSQFPNGRRLGGGTAPNRNQVNVNSVLISLIVAGDANAGLAKGVEVNDKNYLDRFPFLAPRTRVCSRDMAASTCRRFRTFRFRNFTRELGRLRRTVRARGCRQRDVERLCSSAGVRESQVTRPA